jgi:hypothetical protein
MRVMLLIVSFVLGSVDVCLGQPASRLEIGPVVRLDKIHIDGSASGGTRVSGMFARTMISKSYGLEVEVTQASNRIERSYQGWFISYNQDPKATREEIERLAPVLRRSLGYSPGTGVAVAFVGRSDPRQRVSVAGRVGLSSRSYVETSTFTILSISEGIDPGRVARDFSDSSSRRSHGGLVFGLDISVALTRHLSVVPDVRLVWGGPAQISKGYGEAGVGIRGALRF